MLNLKNWVLAGSVCLLSLHTGIAKDGDNNDIVKVKSTIEKVTVFKQNAREHRVAYVNIVNGNSEIVIDQVPNGMVTNSLQIKIANSSVSLLTAVPRLNYIDQADATRRYQEVEDSIKLLQEQLDRLNIKITALSDRRQILLNNNPLGSAKDKGYTPAEIEQLMDFREKELQEIDNKQLDYTYDRTKKTNRMYLLQSQLGYLSAGRKKTSAEIGLQLYSTSSASNVKIEISFVVTNAGWTPLYDLRSDGVDKPMKLDYKANVFQNTGYDWKDVKLVLSTSDPSVSHNRPILDPYYIDFAPDYAQDYKKKSDEYYITYKASGNIILDPQQSMLNIQAEGLRMEDQALTNAPISNIYQAYRNSPSITTGSNPPLNPLPDLDINNNDGTTEFELDINHNIPTDGMKHIVSIKSHDLNAVYEYHTVPKLDRGAFLLAKITDYGKLDLLPGDANIFYEGTYLGQSFIDPRITTDTMLLSLGRDERINVKREKLTDLTSKKTLGTHIKETFVYEITVRNNKTREIAIDILDQIPISRQTDIEVKLEEGSNADYRAEYGALRWKLKIPAGQSQKVRFEYSIRYPKNKTIQYN